MTKNINRKQWTPGPGAKVCSAHFTSGAPAALFDQDNPDWAPNVNLGYDKTSSTSVLLTDTCIPKEGNYIFL